MLRRIALRVGVVALSLAVVAGALYFYGFRLDWTGNMSRVRIKNLAHDNARVEESRAAQRIEPVPAPMAVEKPSGVAAAPVKLMKAAYWTDFRGPNRAGEYSESPINTAWPAAGLPLLWKQPIGGGYASFTVGEGRAYTIEQRRDKEAVTAYDVETGRELWAFSYPASFDEVLGGPGPRATPVYYEGLVYSLGAMGDLYCLSAATGKPKWSKNILADNDAKNIHWAMAGAPLIVDDMVIVAPGGAGGKSIVAYNRLNGAPVWKSLNDRAAYTSPIVATLAGTRQIVWISGERAVGISVDDGKLLWEYPFPAQMDMNCSQPVVIDDADVLLSSAQGPGAALLKIAKDGDAFTAQPVWKNNRLKNKFNSSVLYQGYIYGFDEAILACLDPKTGELKWKGGRYGYGQLLLAGGYLVITTEAGELVLVRATPESHQEVARFQAIEGKTWNIPAIDHGLLLVRNTQEMACFRIGR
ncbi:MAG TPA: PQQ-binding-like beta-propeller repeat protein [Bryobacteraceae bacterium]|nr:PQQ-binding-like beta-propeller repeat protein [Bryobacteraceae bacterium]